MTDAELVDRILDGEERLFAEIVRRYAGYVWALCSSYVRNRTDCEDIVQESFIQCYRRLDTLREPKAFAGWLRQLVRRQCLAWLRASSRREAAITKLAERPAVVQTPVEALECDELHRGIRAQIAALPPKYREALSLYYTGGYSVAEAARFLDITADAMKKRLELGRKKLKERLAEEVQAALAQEKPQGELDKRVLAAIPFGEAVWLGKAGLAATAAAKTGLLGGGATALKAAAIVLAGGLALTWVLYGVLDTQTVTQDVSDSTAPSRVSAVPEVEPPQPEEQAVEAIALAPLAAANAAAAETPRAEEAVSAETAAAMAAEDAKTQQELLDSLQKPISLMFEEEHIDEILEFVCDVHSINLVVDHRVVEPWKRPVSRAPQLGRVPRAKWNPHAAHVTDGMLAEVNLRDVPLVEVLEFLLYPLGLDFVVEPGFVWISSPERIQREVVREADERYLAYDLEERLEGTLASVLYYDEHLCDILEFIADTWKMNLVVDFRAVMPRNEARAFQLGAIDGPPWPERNYITDGLVENVQLDSLTAEQALACVLEPLGLGFNVQREDFVWITSQEKILSDAYPRETGRDRAIRLGEIDGPPWPKTESATDRRLDKKLDPMSLAGKVHLGDVLELIHKDSGIELVVDYTVVKPPSKTSDTVPATPGPTRVTNGFVHYINVRNVQLRDILKAVLRPLGLTYAVENGYVWVSAPEHMGSEDHGQEAVAPETGPVGRALNRIVSVEFEGLPTEMLAMLAEQEDLTIAIDASVFGPLERNGASAEVGRVIDLPVFSLRLENVRLRHAFGALLRQLDLDFAALDDTLWINTAERLEESDFEHWTLLNRDMSPPKSAGSPRTKPVANAETGATQQGTVTARSAD